jgi:hypothetical protein
MVKDFRQRDPNVYSDICTDKLCSKIFMSATVKVMDNRISRYKYISANVRFAEKVV